MRVHFPLNNSKRSLFRSRFKHIHIKWKINRFPGPLVSYFDNQLELLGLSIQVIIASLDFRFKSP